MRRPLFVLLAFLMLAAPARAATLEVTPPVKVAAGGADPVAVMLPDGGAAVAWRAADGVYAARRAAGGAFGDPERLGEGPVLELRLAAGPDGRLAVAWVTGTLGDNDEQRLVRLAVAAPGEPFAAAADVPFGTTGHLRRPRVAVAADGIVAVGFIRYRPGLSEDGVAVLRGTDGSFGEPQPLGSSVINGPDLAADAGGGIVAMWSGRPPGAPGALIQVADRSPGATAFGTPVTVSSTTTNADNNSSPPALAVNDRGDALVAWSPTQITNSIAFASAAWASYRPAGGAWTAPEEMLASGSRPHVALNAGGAGIVVSEAGPGVAAAFRPAGGAFEFDWMKPLAHGLSMNVPVALDDAGNAVAVNAATPPAPRPGIAAVVRPPAGCFGEEVDLSPRGIVTGPASLALRGDGTGAVAWASADGVHLTELRLVAGGRTACPPGTPARPGPATPNGAVFPTTKLSLSKLPSKVSRRTLWREGLRFRVRAAKGSAIAAGLMPAGRTLPKLARIDRRTNRRGVATLRLRMKRAAAARLPRGTRLDLWIFASTPGHQPSGKRRTLTVR